MNPQAAQNYLRTKVLTATPEQLQLMLYDGAIRFGEQARIALQNKSYDQSFQLLDRTQKIVNELRVTLKHDVMPDLCDKMAALYNYAFKKLVDASIGHKIEDLDEALNILKYQRQTWAMLLEELAKGKAGVAAKQINMPAPNARMEASISMQG